MSALSIGEVARQTGLRTSALRFYEAFGLLPAPMRISGRRRYPPDVVRRLELLRFAQQAGFTLAEVKALLCCPDSRSPLSARWRAIARRKVLQLDQLAERVQAMRRALELGLNCGCLRVEDCALPRAPVAPATAPAARARGLAKAPATGLHPPAAARSGRSARRPGRQERT